MQVRPSSMRSWRKPTPHWPQASPTGWREEIGDVLFTVANWARHLQIDAEAALRTASSKFEQRFEQMEALARQRAAWCSERCRAAQWEALWSEAKEAIASALADSAAVHGPLRSLSRLVKLTLCGGNGMRGLGRGPCAQVRSQVRWWSGAEQAPARRRTGPRSGRVALTGRPVADAAR